MSTEKYEVTKQKLNDFDYSRIAKEEFLIFECYKNKSIKKKVLIFIGSTSYAKQIIEHNKGTASPTLWLIREQYLWFKKEPSLSLLLSLFHSAFELGFNQSKLIDLETNEETNIINEFRFRSFGHNFTPFYKFDLPETSDSLLKIGETFTQKEVFDPSPIPLPENWKLRQQRQSDLKGAARNCVKLIDSEEYWLDDVTPENMPNLEFIYLIVNSLYPDILKISYTDDEPRVCAAELTIESGFDTAYQPIYALATHSAHDVEKFLHNELSDLRVAKKFFFFRKERIADAVCKAIMRFGPSNLGEGSQRIFRYEACDLIDQDTFIEDYIAKSNKEYFER